MAYDHIMLYPCIRRWATRIALLIGRYAFKMPSTASWKLFLNGLLANIQEHEFWKGMPEDSRAMMCPVLFHLPGGFLSVMRRAEPVRTKTWKKHGTRWFIRAAGDLHIPVEPKKDSFGYLNGHIVVVDYGR